MVDPKIQGWNGNNLKCLLCCRSIFSGKKKFLSRKNGIMYAHGTSLEDWFLLLVCYLEFKSTKYSFLKDQLDRKHQGLNLYGNL